MKRKRVFVFFVCLNILLSLFPATLTFADVISSADVALENRNVWMDSNFSVMDDEWVLSNGMYHDGEDGVIRYDSGVDENIAEANYSLEGFDFGDSWNIRFRMKLGEEHQGRVDFHFCYGGYRTYCNITPEENKFSLAGNGSRKDREVKLGIWYEYLFQYYIEDGVTKVKIWRKAEGDERWLDIFTGYPFSDANLYTGPPALRFFGGVQGDSKKVAIDDVRVYSGTYAKLNEPIIQGNNITADGVIDTSDYGMTEQRNVSLIAASYDKKYGYTKEVQSTRIVVEPGAETEVNHTFGFTSFDAKTDDVKIMMWDSLESGVPLASAIGTMEDNLHENLSVSRQEIAVVPNVSYNRVNLTGYLGRANEKLTAMLLKDGKVVAITQDTANADGDISTELIVNPACESGTYVLRMQYGKSVATETEVTLQCADSYEGSYGSVEDILGQNVVPHKTFDFKASKASALYSGSGFYSSGMRYFDVFDGMLLNSTTKTTYWRYSPVANWFVIGDRRAVLFRAKMYDETNPLEFRIFEPNKGYAAHQFSLSASGISTLCTYKTLDATFAPGLEWVDYLIVKTSSGIRLYASRDNFLSGSWVPILETTAPYASYASSMGGIHLVGSGYISKMDILNTSSGKEDLKSIIGGDYTTVYNFQMNENGFENPSLTCTDGYTFGAEGLSLSSGGMKFVPLSGRTAIGKKNAILLRTKMTDVADLLTVRVSGESGVARLQLSSTGVNAYIAIGSAKKVASFSGTEWVDYLIVQNTIGGYSVYATNDSVSGWYKMCETEDYPDGADGSVGVEITGTGVIQTLKQLAVAESVANKDAKPLGADIIYYQEDFQSFPAGHSNVSIQNGSTELGVLVLENGSYTVNHGAIPIGGYAEFRVSSEGAVEFTTSDANKSLALMVQNGEYELVTNTTQTLLIGDGGTEFRTWRIVRNKNGTYSGYCKADGDNAWYPAFLNVIGKTVTSTEKTEVSVSEGRAMCDYLMICGPNDTNGLILTDGYGTKVLSEGEKYQYHDCLRALVPMKENETQTVLIAEYVKGALSHWVRKNVPEGSGMLTIPYSVKNTTADVKVFLWDSLSGMAANGSKQMASHNWSLAGKAKDLNGGISLSLEGSGSSTASFTGGIGDSFDIEWDMRINSFSGRERATVYTGTRKIEITFHEDGVSYETTSGTEKISCLIGSITHSYRLVGRDGICYLYLDGTFIGTLKDFPQSSETPRIDFQTER